MAYAVEEIMFTKESNIIRSDFDTEYAIGRFASPNQRREQAFPRCAIKCLGYIPEESGIKKLFWSAETSRSRQQRRKPRTTGTGREENDVFARCWGDR